MPAPTPAAHPARCRLPGRACAVILAWLGLALAAGAQEPIGPPAPGESGRQRVQVWLLTGAQVAGELVREDETEIVLEVAGVEVRLAKGRIARLDRLPSVEAQYRANRRLIGDHDVGQLLRLVDWLIEQDRLDLALAELDSILQRVPAHLEAAQRRVDVQARLDLRRKKGDPDAVPRPPEETFPLLSEEQINLLKVYEVDLADPPRMIIEKDTIRRLITAFADDPKIPQTPEGREALLSRSEAEILALMFELQARDFYGEVRILDMPRAFKLFRKDVHGWLLNRCASPRCHGGEGVGGRLQLASPGFGGNRDDVVLTNFLILDRFRMADGKPLIDYERPERSPLIHLGVQREHSLSPHPAVPGPAGRGDMWRPQFRTERDPGAVLTQAWIRSMYLPRPDYPIEYQPPQGEPPAPAREIGRPR